MISFIDEENLYGAAANDCQSAVNSTAQYFEEISWISEESGNDHQKQITVRSYHAHDLSYK